MDTAASRYTPLFATREPVQAEAFMAQLYGPHALQVQQSGDMDMRLRGFEFAQLHLAELRYGLPARAAMSRAHGHWVFSYLRRGRVGTDAHPEPYFAGEVGLMAPDSVQRLDLSADAELMNLRVADADLHAACRVLLGTDLAQPLRFDLRAPAGSAAAQALLRGMLQLAATPVYGLPVAARMERSLRDALLYELLLAWPNNHARALQQPAALPLSTRRARDFIHAHAAELPSIGEIARAAGVGVRALALGFERHLGVSPLRYLQQYRLDRVRDALLVADSEVTVTDIATAWGFLQLGSFAARYRERFGETPSQTLRGRRGGH